MSKRQPEHVTWLIWAQLMISCVVLGGVLLFLLSNQDEPPPPVETVVLVALIGAAGGVGMISLAWGRLIPFEGNWQATCIVRWALAEAVAVIGFVVGFLGASLPIAYGLMSTGLLLILVQAPTASGREAHEAARRAA